MPSVSDYLTQLVPGQGSINDKLMAMLTGANPYLFRVRSFDLLDILSTVNSLANSLDVPGMTGVFIQPQQSVEVIFKGKFSVIGVNAMAAFSKMQLAAAIVDLNNPTTVMYGADFSRMSTVDATNTAQGTSRFEANCTLNTPENPIVAGTLVAVQARIYIGSGADAKWKGQLTSATATFESAVFEGKVLR